MTGEKISIIVPCYNIEKQIEQTVKSICEQTYDNIEIILVNDGSTDATLEIIQSLAARDPRIIFIDKKNEGVTKARMDGVAAATGQWVGFVDGDDYIEPDMYEHLLSNALRYSADISHCGYRMIYPSKVVFYHNTGRTVEQDNQTGLRDLLNGDFVEPGLWNKLYKKELVFEFLRQGCMDYSIKNTEDLLMNYYLFRQAQKSVYEDFCPYHYILRPGSATSKLNAHKLYDPIKVLLQIEKNTAGDEVLNKIVQIRIVAKLITLSSRYQKDHKELITEYRKKARLMLRKRLPAILFGRCNLKIKISALWVIVSPHTYHFVHERYSKMNGSYGKYLIK